MATMGGDPDPGKLKYFGALVRVNGRSLAFACPEGQTIDFSESSPPRRA